MPALVIGTPLTFAVRDGTGFPVGVAVRTRRHCFPRHALSRRPSGHGALERHAYTAVTVRGYVRYTALFVRVFTHRVNGTGTDERGQLPTYEPLSTARPRRAAAIIISFILLNHCRRPTAAFSRHISRRLRAAAREKGRSEWRARAGRRRVGFSG